MKLRTFTLTVMTGLLLWSCEESSDSDGPLSNVTAATINGVNTINPEEFCCWKTGSTIQFNSTNSNYTYWNITIGESNGIFHQINGNSLQWRGAVTYMVKDKYCNEIVYLDSISLDINLDEGGRGDAIYRTGSTQYEKGAYPAPFYMTTYHIKPEGGINTLNVYDASQAYQFRFKTRTTDDINSWKIDQMPQGWMNSNGKISMLMVPIVYSLF